MKRRSFMGRLAGGLAATANAGLVAMHLKRPAIDVRRLRRIKGRDGHFRYYVSTEYLSEFDRIAREYPVGIGKFGDVDL